MTGERNKPKTKKNIATIPGEETDDEETIKAEQNKEQKIKQEQEADENTESEETTTRDEMPQQ